MKHFYRKILHVEYRSHLLIEVTDEAQNENKKKCQGKRGPFTDPK